MPTVVGPPSPDGSDSTQALQQALDAAGAGDRQVHLSAGTYGVKKALVVPAGVRVLGMGAGVSILKGMQTFQFGSAEMMVQVGGNDVSIEALTIDGTGAADPADPARKLIYGVFAAGVSGLAVRNCVVKGAVGGGGQVHLVDCTSATIQDTEVSTGARGITLQGGCSHVAIVRCNVHHLSAYGIYVVWTPGAAPRTSSYVTIDDCDVYSMLETGCPKHPIYFVANDSATAAPLPGVYHRHARVINNRVTGNNASYIPKCTEPPPAGHTTGTGTADNIGMYQCQDAVVVGNHSTKGGDLGIALDYSERCTVAGNVCTLNDTDGIGVWRSRACVVSGNVCYNNGQWRFTHPDYPKPSLGGIGLVNADANTIVGNRCYDDQPSKTQSYGIVADAESTGNVIVGNHLEGNATAAYKLDSAQVLGLQYNGSAQLAMQALGFAGTSGAPDVSLVRIAPSVLRATGFLAVGDEATGVGGTLNVRANSKDTEGVNVRGVTDQAADLLRVQAHNGSDALRVGAGGIGFLGKSPVGKQTVSGSTTDDRLNSLLAALRTLGLIAEPLP